MSSGNTQTPRQTVLSVQVLRGAPFAEVMRMDVNISRRHFAHPFRTQGSRDLMVALMSIGSWLCSLATVTMPLAAPATLMMTGSTLAAQDAAIGVQGGWAYTRQNRDGMVEHVAATKAREDDIWLVLGCRADEQLTVFIIHAAQFPFPLSPISSVQLRSSRMPSFSVAARSSHENQFFIDPVPLRHVLPLLISEEQLFLTIHEQNGATHNYTFSIQPNDVALKPILLRCLE
jgi:hypothetical protein